MPFRAIASHHIRAHDANRGEFEVHIRLGAPVQVGTDEWQCDVALDGLHDNLRPQHGVDSWQALVLAQNLARMLLRYFVEDGGTLRHLDSDEPLDLNELFGRGV